MSRLFKLVEIPTSSVGSDSSGCLVIGLIALVFFFKGGCNYLKSTFFYWDKILLQNNTQTYIKSDMKVKGLKLTFEPKEYLNVEVKFKNSQSLEVKSLKIPIPIIEASAEIDERDRIDGTKELEKIVLAPKYLGREVYLLPKSLLKKGDESYRKIVSKTVKSYVSLHKNEFVGWQYIP